MAKIEFEVPYPATTRKPRPRRPGMVVHEYLDLTAYCGTLEQDRYYAAGYDDAKRRQALAAMPLATVKFIEVPAGEPFFVEAPEGFFDQFPELEDEEADGQDAARNAASSEDGRIPRPRSSDTTMGRPANSGVGQ